MKTKQEIVENWLPRYTERKLEHFTRHILLTNFTKYVELFAEHYGVPILGLKNTMPNASADGMTIINFGMGSSNAATIMDLLSAIKPDAVLFLGKCGGLKRATRIGDYLLPIAAIRGEGTSNEYLPPEVPSLPAFSMLRAISSAVRHHGAQIVEVNPTYTVVSKKGLTEDIMSLYYALNEYQCVLQYVRSGRIAITKSRTEYLDAFLEERRRTYEAQQNGNQENGK